MAKKIIETTTRWCCQPQDIVADVLHPETIHPTFKPGAHNPPRFKVCRHCGQRYEYHSFTDAAGSSDSTYRPLV